MNRTHWQDYLSMLSSIDENWIDKVVKNKRIENNELIETLVEFLDVLKDLSKTDIGLPEEIRDELKLDNGLLEWVERWVDNVLQGYRGFAPIRALADTNEEIVHNLLRVSFDNYVLRYDPKFFENYATFKLSSEDMIKVLQLLDSLTDYYVVSHMTKSAICEDFAEETGLSDELCDFYASLIDENYELLLMNYIAENLANIQRKEPTV